MLSPSSAILVILFTYYTGINGDDNIWVDSLGRSCADYIAGSLCMNGSYGNRWRYDKYGLFKHYADDNGFDATDKCCECANPALGSYRLLQCELESFTIWEDSRGLTCEQYVEKGFCKGE